MSKHTPFLLYDAVLTQAIPGRVERTISRVCCAAYSYSAMRRAETHFFLGNGIVDLSSVIDRLMINCMGMHELRQDYRVGARIRHGR